MSNDNRRGQRNYSREIPELPKFCRMCGAQMDAIREDVIAYDIYTKEPRTMKYLYACRDNLQHTKLVVVDTPARNFRCVIREDRFDESRVRR